MLPRRRCDSGSLDGGGGGDGGGGDDGCSGGVDGVRGVSDE